MAGPVERCAFEVHVGVQVDAGGGDGLVDRVGCAARSGIHAL